MSKQEVYKRDGGLCFYCAKPLTIDEATLEHLLAKSNGGTNGDPNLALACKEHNHDAGSLPIVEKVRMRDEIMGSKRIQSSPNTQAAIKILRTTLQSDCANELADKLTTIAIEILEDKAS